MQPVNMPPYLSTGPWKEEPEEPTGDSYPSKVHRGIVKLCVCVHKDTAARWSACLGQ